MLHAIIYLLIFQAGILAGRWFLKKEIQREAEIERKFEEFLLKTAIAGRNEK